MGRAIVQEALARGHEVVMFNRGRTNPSLFPEARTVRGDRTRGDLAQLSEHAFDAVFDTAAYHPHDVDATAAIADGVGCYCVVSSLSALRDPVPRGADETAPVWMPTGPLPAQFTTPEEYGLLKAQSEIRARAIYGDRALIVRPGIVVGPHDYTDRLTSWLRRLATRDVVLAADAGQPIQLIDARDLAAWMIDAAASRAAGVFNATGPDHPIVFSDLLATAAEVCRSRARVVWAGDAFLEQRGLELPLWIPRADHAFFTVSNARALAAGLTLRPLAETLADVKAWDDARPEHEPPGLPDAREDALLAELSGPRRAQT